MNAFLKVGIVVGGYVAAFLVASAAVGIRLANTSGPNAQASSGMARYVAWIKSLNDKPVFVAYPAGFDFLFVYWYLMRFVGEARSDTRRST